MIQKYIRIRKRMIERKNERKKECFSKIYENERRVEIVQKERNELRVIRRDLKRKNNAK